MNFEIPGYKERGLIWKFFGRPPDGAEVSPEYWIQFLDRCLEILREEGSRVGGCLAPDRQDLLMRLVDRRREAECCLGKRRAPLPPDFSSSTSPHHTVISDGISQSTALSAVENEDIKVVNDSPAKYSGKSRHSKTNKQVIHITSHCHTNNVHGDCAVADKSTPPNEGNSIKTDPGSPVTYHLVEQVGAYASDIHKLLFTEK
ncbi:hypothetical protein L9F63_001738 [Diploptera punctata]|uniref:Uncharacterized protein n=1 Tax=Diploptera punctata TaxID=6984 RepID=A0AAD8A2Z0_DIPPU|nr:hypothetical protein L9F63_001738 [Diploptera punctata]